MALINQTELQSISLIYHAMILYNKKKGIDCSSKRDQERGEQAR